MSLYQSLHKSALICILAALVLLLCSFSAAAQKIVLMPMADISKGENGVNLEFTKVVETTLKQLGVELVSRNKIKLFMARNKVRTYRYLDNYLIKKIGTEFDSSLVLIGTITELDEKDLSLGFTFTALDALDGSPVWSTSEATSLQEQLRAFGVGEPKTINELARPLLKEALAPVAQIAHQPEASERRDYQLLGLQLYPGYVRGGQELEANLKIRFLGERPTLIAAESAAGKSYLQYDRRTDSYKGEWFAPPEDGTYKVDLRIEWGREQTVEKLESVASYEVINQPPGLKIEIKKAVQIGQRLAFRDHILILPRIENVRPMAGWALEIKRESGETSVYEEYEGEMPERMVWEGRSSDGFRMANGVYDVSLEVWDLAGNRSTDTRRVAFQASAPKVVGKITTTDEKANLNLNVEGFFEFPLTSWQVELRSLSGKTLVKGKGKALPAVLDFNPVVGETHVLLTITGEDVLGNRLRVKRQKLPVLAVEKKIEEQEAESWVPDF